MAEIYTLPGNQVMEEVVGDLGKRLRKDFFMYKDGVMIDSSEQWILPTNYLKFANFLHKFRYHSSDIVVATFPKSGTIWVQEIIWNLLHNPDLNNPDSKESIDIRSPSLHADMLLATTGVPLLDIHSKLMKKFRMLFPGKEQTDGVFLHLTAVNPSPRLLKTYLPLCFLPPNLPDICKVVYVAREPRDVINSLYFFMKLNKLYGYTGTYDEFVDYFIDDKVCFGPYWKHLQLAWEMRDHPNFLFIFYEDLMENIEREVRRIDEFLGTQRTEDQIKKTINFTSFENLRMKYKCNPLPYNPFFNDEEMTKENGLIFRKGAVGDWKENFTPEQVEKVNQWMNKNMTEFGADFRYHSSTTEDETNCIHNL